jgi:uncharacterized protein (TIGR03083 family)
LPLPVVDTRPLFAPLTREIVAVLRALPPEGWMRPTIAGSWRVRDVVAHLLDTALRRLSFHRDGARPPGPPPSTDRELTAMINRLNAIWIEAADRLSARVLTDAYAAASVELAAFFETLSLDAPAIFPVSWAGESQSAQWLDLGREFTEIWHHGAQIRHAIGAGPFPEPAWLHTVLEIAMHGLPHAYREIAPRSGAAIVVEITGAAGGAWTVSARAAGGWDVDRGPAGTASAVATLADEDAWRLLFNALSIDDARARVSIAGDETLVMPLLRARSVIV